MKQSLKEVTLLMDPSTYFMEKGTLFVNTLSGQKVGSYICIYEDGK